VTANALALARCACGAHHKYYRVSSPSRGLPAARGAQAMGAIFVSAVTCLYSPSATANSAVAR